MQQYIVYWLCHELYSIIFHEIFLHVYFLIYFANKIINALINQPHPLHSHTWPHDGCQETSSIASNL